MTHKLSTSFGFHQVTPAERRRRVRAVFDDVARRYDLMNDLMSFGIHRLWKRSLAAMAAALPGGLAVDLAGGTGDVARLLMREDKWRVLVCDASPAMMETGRDGAAQSPQPGWVAAEGEKMPLADDAADLVTIAFGLRNMSDPEAALSQCRRILKPGGRFICLEFSRPHALLRPFYDLYSFQVIPRLGAWIAGNPDAYQYLIESIRRFPKQEDLAGMLREAGFEEVAYRNLFFGVACLHWGTAPARVRDSA
ncbi:MAG: bifunctional demethylmenaquinone methyltransferase/2-methoxy-6-polyprenyl-1,4-benzoquinol methylase [Hyphomicrobiales bacterium]|nr:MAG: bifunctional demethylmenaquinone methyltransferase/2-methoxy-6-polyprenyl-1,4-benzoquinol methylase [Hyphomicrobiales bacterium]